MFETALFLGLAIDEPLKKTLDKLNPHMKQLFIQNGSEYLHCTDRDGCDFLGKRLDKVQEISRFELLEANIKSLIKKLAPDYPLDERELTLFPVTTSS